MVHHERQRERKAESTTRDWIRWGGIAALLAGGLYAATTAIGLLDPQTSLVTYASETLLAVALLSSLGGFYGLYRAHQDRLGWIGLIGFVVAFIATAAMGAVATANIVVEHEILDLVYYDSIHIWHIGGTVFGLALLWISVLSWYDGSLGLGIFSSWVGVMVLVGPAVTMTLEPAAGVLVLGLSWVAIGYALWSRGPESVTPAAVE